MENPTPTDAPDLLAMFGMGLLSVPVGNTKRAIRNLELLTVCWLTIPRLNPFVRL